MNVVNLTPAMRRLAELLESRTGQNLSENRIWRLETSLKPVLKSHGMHSLDELVEAITRDPAGALAQESVNALLNNETSFFRDAHQFQMIGRTMLPQLMERIEAEGGDRMLRIWCAGCSTGQEAYSLAMLIRREIETHSGWRFRILATDISTSCIERANSGLFAQADVQRGLPINDLLRWFEPVGDRWQIHSALRAMIEFRVDNLFECRAPRGEYDIVLCRNVLLYFSGERKRLLFKKLAAHCKANGHLLLGAGEAVIGHTSEFVASQRFRGTYERVDPSVRGAHK
tara:strand:- start:17560 stop:18417 length:858 start_codon:yes stop_codon:yes gene_type:complete